MIILLKIRLKNSGAALASGMRKTTGNDAVGQLDVVVGNCRHSHLVTSIFWVRQDMRSSAGSEEGGLRKSKGTKWLSRRERGNEWIGHLVGLRSGAEAHVR